MSPVFFLTLIVFFTLSSFRIKGFTLLVISFPFFSFFDNLRTFYISPTELIMILLIMHVLKKLLYNPQNITKRNITLHIFIISVIISASYHIIFTEIDSWELFIKDTAKAILGPSFSACLVIFFTLNPVEIKKILKPILITSSLIILVSLLLIVANQDITLLRSSKFVYETTATGTILGGTILSNPNHIARFLYLSVPLIILYTEFKNTSKQIKVLSILVIIMSILLSFAMLSRMAIIVLFLSLFILSITYRNTYIVKTTIILTMTLPLLLLLIGDKLNSRVEKLQNWEQQARIVAFNHSVTTIRNNLTFGIAPGNFKKVTEEAGLISKTGEGGKASHNNFLFFAVQFGIPVTITFILMLFFSFMYLIRSMKFRKSKIHRLFLVSGAVTILSYVLAGMTATVIGMDYFWYLLGVFLAHKSLFQPTKENL